MLFMLCLLRLQKKKASQHALHYASAKLYHSDDFGPNSCIPLLRSCAQEGSLQAGLRVHHNIAHFAMDRDWFVQSLLVYMYGSCGALYDALELFACMGVRSVYAWTFVMRACSQQGLDDLALQFLHQMMQEGTVPDHVSSNAIFSMCANSRLLFEGQKMHCRIANTGIVQESFTGTALVNMYGRCGSLNDAQRIFDVLTDPNVVSWTGMIGLYVQEGLCIEALQLFYQMQYEGILLDEVALLNMLSVFASPSALPAGKYLHMIILYHGFESDASIGSALVHMYDNCQSIEDAWKLFNKLIERNLSVWNAMVAVCGHHELSTKASLLFEQMQAEAVLPGKVTYISLVDAHGKDARPIDGKRLHARLVNSGFESEVAIVNALIKLYGNFGMVKDAWKLFDCDTSSFDLPLWTSMISIFAQYGCGREALQLFEQLNQVGLVPDEVTWVSVLDACADDGALAKGMQIHSHISKLGSDSSMFAGTALLNMYGDCGDVHAARKIFDCMPNKDLITWNAMISVLAQNAEEVGALQLLSLLLCNEHIVPNSVTFLSIMSANACEADEARMINACIVEYGLEQDVDVGDFLIKLYGKSGVLMDAWRTFMKMPVRNVLSWNSMIATYALYGLGLNAVQLLPKMLEESIKPSNHTFLSIFNACSHAGLRDEGCHLFLSMEFEHALIPCADHYNCMIDMLGRMGKLDEADRLILCMPMQPTSVSYLSLLSACRYQIDVTRSDQIVKYLLELDAENSCSYVLLSNIYAEGEMAVSVLVSE